MMNIKLSNEDKRNDILVHICKISELDICLFVDTGFNKMGNMSMENHLEKMGYRWVSVARRRKNGGIGFMIREGIKVDKPKDTGPHVLWLKLEGKPPPSL